MAYILKDSTIEAIRLLWKDKGEKPSLSSRKDAENLVYAIAFFLMAASSKKNPTPEEEKTISLLKGAAEELQEHKDDIDWEDLNRRL